MSSPAVHPIMPAAQVLPAPAWSARADAHAARADALTQDARRRASEGRSHAVEDFLYHYYPTRPAQLRRWHPGVGVALAPPDGTDREDYADRARWRWYARTPEGLSLDVRSFVDHRGTTIRYVHDLLSRTAGRPAQFGCFGLHEWAMVYRDGASSRTHRHPLPLRLGQDGTDMVVETHTIRCTHFDAFRFFTPEARDRTADHPTREGQRATEQGGCLHATMDLYKWALKLGPAVPGELLLDAFELARDTRVLDMRASPYDVTSYGHTPVAIETPEGKATYVLAQRDLAGRGAEIRTRLAAVCYELLP